MVEGKRENEQSERVKERRWDFSTSASPAIMALHTPCSATRN